MATDMTQTLNYRDLKSPTKKRTMKFTFPPESTPLEGFTIKRAIHRGGFGEVYYALSDAGKEVALKLLQQNLEVELRGVSQCLNLKHPNLVTIFDVRTDSDGDHWIVMEYVSGKSLDRVVDDSKKGMPIDDVTGWLEGICAGLGFLHDRGIVHRDLKPANIYREAKVVKIGDIGLAKFISESRRNAQTQSVGTVYYMAPEVAHGRYGREVDIYSLGVVLYEMLTGDVPFNGESTAEILMKHLSEQPDLSRIPENLRPVLAEVLHKDPEQRTATAQTLFENYKQALSGKSMAMPIPDESFYPEPPAASKPDDNPVSEYVLADDAASKKVNVRTSDKPNGHDSVQGVRDLHNKQRHDHLERTVEKRLSRYERKLERKAAHFARKMQKKADRFARKHDIKSPRQTPIPVVAHGENPVATAKPKPESSVDSDSTGFGGIVAHGIGIVVLLAVGRALHLGFIEIAILWCAGYYIFSREQDRGKNKKTSPVQLGGPQQPVEVHPHVQAASRRNKANNLKGQRLTPETMRRIPVRHRVTEMTGSMTMAAFCTVLVTIGLYVATSMFSDIGQLFMFSGVTLAGSWMVIFSSKLTEGTRMAGSSRRLMMLVGGLALGALAFGLDQAFLVDYGANDFLGSASRYPIGRSAVNRLVDFSSHQPTAAGYMIFFGLLFSLRHWWRHADSFRKRRVRIGSVILTFGLAVVLILMFPFPQPWGLIWATAISCIVQLSSPWVTKDERRELLSQQRRDIVA